MEVKKISRNPERTETPWKYQKIPGNHDTPIIIYQKERVPNRMYLKDMSSKKAC
jgi:hypothetical protein